MTVAEKRLPEWFRTTKSKQKATQALSERLQTEVPNSICQEARCPNRSECFEKGVLTFMILGTVCTRNCGFCSVAHGLPLPPDSGESARLIRAIETLSLKFVVITSPNRDDLPDGGASHYATIIRDIKSAFPLVKVEVLIPDFQGNPQQLDTVIEARPDVINHNLETVPRLYKTVRRGSFYQRSLDVLAYVNQNAPHILTKTGLMVGLGEEVDDLNAVFLDIANQGVDILTLGQYLKPDKDNLSVEKYYHPSEFDTLKEMALNTGIRHVFSGPKVRSSYLADHVFDTIK